VTIASRPLFAVCEFVSLEAITIPLFVNLCACSRN